MTAYAVKVGAVYGHPDYIRTIQASSPRQAIQQVVATMPSSEHGSTFMSCWIEDGGYVLDSGEIICDPNGTRFMPN